MRDTNASTRVAQARALETAIHWGEDWGRSDLEVIAGFPEDTSEELARALGRTVYAIQSVRQALREGRLDAQGRRAKPQPEFRFWFAKGWNERV